MRQPKLDCESVVNEENVEEEYNHSITVFGAMNPRIHHPSWYRLVGLLDGEDEKAAREDEQMICSELSSFFRTGSFLILCRPNEWMVQAATEYEPTLLLNLTSVVFDERLAETPITAFGINFESHSRTCLPDVGEYLADRVSGLPLNLTNPRARMHFTSEADAPGRRVVFRIEPSVKSSKLVFVHHYFYYEFTEPGKVELHPAIEAHLQSDFEFASGHRTQIVAQLNRSEEIN